MRECLLSSRSLQRINLEEPPHEVNEVLVFALETLLQSRLLGHQDIDLELFVVSRGRLGLFLARALSLFFSISLLIDETFASEKVRDKASLLHHVLWDRSDNSNHSGQETLNRVILEEYISSEELSQDASETPNVDLVVVAASENDLRGAIRARLHIGAQMVMDEAAAAKVDDLDLTARVRLDQNVLWLKVTVDKL